MSKQYINTNSVGTFYYKDPEKTLLHREDGPAIEYANGDNTWYLNGTPHRTDGPAYISNDGSKSWYVNGVFIFEIGRISNQLVKRMK